MQATKPTPPSAEQFGKAGGCCVDVTWLTFDAQEKFFPEIYKFAEAYAAEITRSRSELVSDAREFLELLIMAAGAVTGDESAANFVQESKQRAQRVLSKIGERQ
jgi:hypothetical protein